MASGSGSLKIVPSFLPHSSRPEVATSLEHFQKSMQEILEDLSGVECQMDDIIVYGTSQAEYDERLEAVLDSNGPK